LAKEKADRFELKAQFAVMQPGMLEPARPQWRGEKHRAPF